MPWHRLSSMKKLNLKHRAQYICQQDMNRMVKYCKTHFVWVLVKYYRNLSPSMLIIMPCQYSMRDDQLVIKSVQQSLAQSFQFSTHWCVNSLYKQIWISSSYIRPSPGWCQVSLSWQTLDGSSWDPIILSLQISAPSILQTMMISTFHLLQHLVNQCSVSVFTNISCLVAASTLAFSASWNYIYVTVKWSHSLD